MQLKRKFFLHFLIVLQSEKKLQVYLLTSQHNTMCQERLCNGDEFGSTKKFLHNKHRDKKMLWIDVMETISKLKTAIKFPIQH